MFERLSQFTKTRLILSFWYTFILLIILISFSTALSVTYNNDVTRIVLKRDFGNHVPKIFSKTEIHIITSQVRELRRTFRLDLVMIDLVTLVVGGGLSYFLAGKTLQPIQKNMASQKLFIADASHELKSPIATIRSACEVVLRSPTKTKEDYKEVVMQVLDQSQRLGRLVNDLLSLSVLDAGNMKPLTLCSLSSLAKKEGETMKTVVKKAHLTFHSEITPHVSVLGDADKIEQLIVILLDNAIKYTPVGGSITIQVVNKPQPQLIVTDTGIGIEKEKQQDIFKRFYQADRSHASSGAGLGLAIAKSIMKLHKGKILVESTFGRGSTFVCVFPKA